MIIPEPLLGNGVPASSPSSKVLLEVLELEMDFSWKLLRRQHRRHQMETTLPPPPLPAPTGVHQSDQPTWTRFQSRKLSARPHMSIYCLWILLALLSSASFPEVFGESGNSFESCKKSSVVGQGSDLNLACQLKTINGYFDRGNFSGGILVENVVSLQVSCSDVHFYQSSLQPGNLATLPRLGDLHIEHCKLSRLPPGVLSGLNFLRNLTVRTHNTAWPVLSLDIGPGVFSSQSQLERIDLSANNIWTFPDRLFCPAASLERLNVSLNRLQDLSDLSFREKEPKEGTESPKGIGGTGPGPTSCKMGIQVLDVSRNRLILLPAKGLSTLSQLKELYLQGNEISVVAERALNGLKGLRILNLADNKVQSLPEELFLDSPEITEIYLQNNSLTAMAPRLFTKLDQLVVLDLSYNALSSTWMNGGAGDNNHRSGEGEGGPAGENGENERASPPGTFGGLIRLVLLNLGHNRLTHLVPESFRDLYSLQILNVEYNQIETIDGNTFSAMNNLHTLILSYNRLSFIDSTSLNGLFVLSLLSLDNNNITAIHPAAFHNCSSLKDLNLNGNGLDEIPFAVQNLTLLKTVDLGENGIDALESPPKLIGLPNLYGLRLTGNRIVNVSKDALKDLPSLKILNLARNQLQSVEQGAFDSNSNLQAVRLDSNYLADVSNLFAQSPSLIWLNMSDNHLTWFDYALIPQQLQWIDLHKNEITELGNFYGRTDLRLQTLDASFNRITRVGSGNLPDSIEMLFLNDNLITHVEPHTFFKKSNLSRVDIFANQIETLELSSLRLTPFPEERPLPEFYIGGNPIVCDCNMEWLQRINKLDHLRQHPKVMDLDSVYCKLVYHRDKYYVPLAEADPSQFLCSYQTHCFHLCHCCDFDACDCQMTCPDNCTCYHDDTWTANIADCASRGHTSVPSRIPMDSTEVYLDGNFFEELPSHVFIARKNLQVLYLNHSGISVIGNNSFSGLKRLTVLHLENNFLTDLRGFEFEPLESLRELYLQSNQIRFIANHTFLTLRGLEVLQLDGNQLRRFSVWTLSQNPYLVEVALAGNPWSCDCEFVSQAAPWVQSNAAKLMDASGVNCQLNGKILSLVYMNGTKCSEITALSGAVEAPETSLPPYWPLIGGVMGICLILGMILLALCRKRASLRVWATSKCPLNQCYQTTLDSEDREKLYDAYVAYSVKDEAWVSQVLASELTQSETPLRLLLHYKEFGATSYISDTIVEAVESSKRTVIILSKNFVQSEWARFEFKSALHAALRGKKNRLIAVTLGDLPTRDLDPDLRVALRTATILSANDKLFWAKLKCALPDPRISYTLSRSGGGGGGALPRHHNSLHHPHHQSHPLQHQTLGGLSYTSTGTLERGGHRGVGNGGSLSNCNSIATTPNSGSVSVPLYVPPFPPPNRPPPPFPTPRRPPPPAPIMWG